MPIGYVVQRKKDGKWEDTNVVVVDADMRDYCDSVFSADSRRVVQRLMTDNEVEAMDKALFEEIEAMVEDKGGTYY